MTQQWSSGRVLTLDFDCLQSLPEGVAEVRVWHDNLLKCERVGKRIDLNGMGCHDVINEPATLQRIDHPNVVPVVSAARVGGYMPGLDVVEIVTPYYRRGSITDALLAGEQFAAREAIAITQNVLRGLGALHEQYGLCHRDVKSGNVLLPDVGEVAKVADLGLASAFAADATVAAADNPTLYSPPEVGSKERIGRATDLWGVGLILRELLGGHFPYEAYTKEGILQRLQTGKAALLPRDARLPVWVPRSVVKVYRKATQPRPSDRYQTAAAFDEALAGVLAVDWREDEVGAAWTAPFVHHPGFRVRVEATSLPRGGYRLATRVDRGSGYRRPAGTVDVTVQDLTGPQTRRVFDQASRMASER